jgi:small-conductance mechanosensitive channel
MRETLDSYLEKLDVLFEGHPYLEAAAIVVAAAITAKLVDLIITRILLRLTKKSKTDFDDRLVGMLHKPVFVSVFLIGLWLALTRAALAPGIDLFLTRVLKTVAILVWWGFLNRAAGLILEALSHLKNRFSFIEPKTVALLDNTAKILVFAGATYAILVSWNIDVGGFLVSAGVIGLALGLAAKDTLANLFSGIFILADGPYQKGDFVVLDSGERGMVTDIGLRSTRLLTRDDVEVTVPNAVIGNAKIINESSGRWEKERLRVKVGVAYGSDVDQVERILTEIAVANPAVCEDPEPRVRFRAFGDSSLDFELLAWITEPVLRGRVMHALNSEVYKAFAREGVEIPYPKRDLYLHHVGEGTEAG